MSAWLKKQNESTVRFLVQLIDDYFYKGKAMCLQKVGDRCMFSGVFFFWGGGSFHPSDTLPYNVFFFFLICC